MNYHLDTTSHKERCPQCGHRTFVLYLDDTRRPLSSEVGRCDREHKCAYHCPPSQFFRLHGLKPRRRTTTPAYKPLRHSSKPPVTPSYIDAAVVRATNGCYDRNHLVAWLWRQFGRLVSARDFETVLRDYRVGTCRHWPGATVWWQVDGLGRVHAGKVMAYDPDTGKRVKQPRPLMTWVHTLLRDKYSDFNLNQAYFGEHLLAERPDAPVWLVESEKAALVLALGLMAGGAYRRFVPIACGGCNGLDTSPEAQGRADDRLQSLKGRRVVLMPDNGMYDDWSGRAHGLQGFAAQVTVSAIMEPERRRSSQRVECETLEGDGPDDLVLRYLAMGAPWYPLYDLMARLY